MLPFVSIKTASTEQCLAVSCYKLLYLSHITTAAVCSHLQLETNITRNTDTK